jgi:hypothetical protein
VNEELPAEEVRELGTYSAFDEGIPVTDRDHGRQLIEQMAEDVSEARRAERRAEREENAA